MNEKWRKVLLEILKYSIGAVCGAFGINFVSGCSSMPVFFF